MNHLDFEIRTSVDGQTVVIYKDGSKKARHATHEEVILWALLRAAQVE